nr:MAG TPA: hypothetical protein [Caudoviricetes sp.]
MPAKCPRSALKIFLKPCDFSLDNTLILAYNKHVNKRGEHPRRKQK